MRLAIVASVSVIGLFSLAGQRGVTQSVPNAQAAVEIKSPQKATSFHYSHLRSGLIKEPDGWNFRDFAVTLMNPNSTPIPVNLKLISDDPNFVFLDGHEGTWQRTFKLPRLAGMTG